MARTSCWFLCAAVAPPPPPTPPLTRALFVCGREALERSHRAKQPTQHSTRERCLAHWCVYRPGRLRWIPGRRHGGRRLGKGGVLRSGLDGPPRSGCARGIKARRARTRTTTRQRNPSYDQRTCKVVPPVILRLGQKTPGAKALPPAALPNQGSALAPLRQNPSARNATPLHPDTCWAHHRAWSSTPHAPPHAPPDSRRPNVPGSMPDLGAL